MLHRHLSYQWLSIGLNCRLNEELGLSLEDVGKAFLKLIQMVIVPLVFPLKAMGDGQLLPIIFFGLFLGLPLAAIGEKGKPVLEFLDSWTQAMFKVIEYVISFAPIGFFGFIAYDVAKYGVASLLSLGQSVLIAYVGFLSVALILFPIISLIFKIPYFQMLKEIWDLILLAFATWSSEWLCLRLLTA